MVAWHPSETEEAAGRELSNLELLAWRAMVVGTGRLVSKLDEQLQAEASLSLADYEILSYLSEAPGWHLRMTELAEGVVISRSGLTRRVDGLVRRELVKRYACESDRRGTYAQLTDAGFSVLKAAVPAHRAGVRRYFLDLLPDTSLPTMADAMVSLASSLGMWPVGAAAFR